ncbi:alpha/beta fold hydrolase [Burkholderia stabilis]|uniref:alpha/beta fold hydrolase n=1 Tax=Burkholderia stabilis TaxID=95485 RepID=UPI0009F3BDFD|nr:alpha/beta hydrolase [Burkholderia stabilis]HDR9490089.1 alpha/beta hydrolase [Burkholderia stabilis]HDR9521643.1 alpha/beta hydrolase [Burkholderia stabilis]HDR9537194.1 alpha/beta hydrolase [Burkholderia stabilis]HDR9575140.1 alpha/beta hydrolase [Burkholderia stabilis]HDR9624315.1 alpha/beta hydrolase [Burkholderia stabilis]
MEANPSNSWLADGAGPADTAIESAARLYSTDVGSGRNVMLLHGWTCDADDWSGQAPSFSNRYRTVTVELRGHGRSEIMPSGAYSPEDYVADIESLITTRYASEPFILVGHSMGGQIAARLAARRPELVRAIVSVDGALGLPAEAAEVFAKTASDMNGEDTRGVVTALFEQVYGPGTDPAHKRLHANRLQSVPLHVIRESFVPLFFGEGQVGIGEASAAFCAGLTVPVYHLCIDPVQADRMRPWFSHPKSKVQAWSDAGHWIMQDRKDDVNAAVTSWIDSL